MSSIWRWITAPDDNPAAHLTSNNTDQRNAVILRKEKDKPLHVSRRSTNPDSVTYASKDDQRNVQFVCHLPTGSPHAARAQKIAGSIFSGRPGDTGDRLLGGGGGESRLLEDEDTTRTRREREERERRATMGSVGDAEIVTTRLRTAHREPATERRFHEDEAEETLAPPRRRTSKIVTRELITSPRDELNDDSEYRRDSQSKMTDDSTTYYAESIISNPTSRASSSPAQKQNQTQTHNPAGFRHQSDVHVTYNIKNKDGRRQLFVSAPVGSPEAEMHDHVAARAANTSSAARIQSSDSECGSKRSRWIGL